MANIRLAVCGMMLLLFTFGGAAAVLRGPVANGNGFAFGLDCEPNAIYLLEQSTNLADWSVVAQ